MNLTPLLLIIFTALATLKLAGTITWSWWIVALPLYPIGAMFVIAILALSIAASAMSLKVTNADRRKRGW